MHDAFGIRSIVCEMLGHWSSKAIDEHSRSLINVFRPVRYLHLLSSVYDQSNQSNTARISDNTRS